MKTKGKTSRKKRKCPGKCVPPFPIEFRLKVARLREEDGYPAKLIAEQFGISQDSVYRWAKRYRIYGQQGLVNQPRGKSTPTISASMTQSIIDLKKENPARGANRISDILKRFFMVGASPSTVQRTLRDQGLTQPVKKKRKTNPAKPQFFERATGITFRGSFAIHYEALLKAFSKKSYWTSDPTKSTTPFRAFNHPSLTIA